MFSSHVFAGKLRQYCKSQHCASHTSSELNTAATTALQSNKLDAARHPSMTDLNQTKQLTFDHTSELVLQPSTERTLLSACGTKHLSKDNAAQLFLLINNLLGLWAGPIALLQLAPALS